MPPLTQEPKKQSKQNVAGTLNEAVLPAKPTQEEGKGKLPENNKIISPELKKVMADLNNLSVAIEDQLKPPLEKMIKESDRPLNSRQVEAIQDFNEKGMEVYTTQAIKILKDVVSLPPDLQTKDPEDRMAVISTSLAKQGLYLYSMPKNVLVTFEGEQLQARERNFTHLLAAQGYPEEEARQEAKKYAKEESFSMFAPKVLELGQAVKGADAFSLKNNKEFQLPSVEGQKVAIPKDIGIEVREIVDKDANNISIRGATISFTGKDPKDHLKMVILNPNAIQKSATKLGVDVNDMYNHTKANELGALSLAHHLGEKLTKPLLEKLILVDIPVSTDNKTEQKGIVQLAIGYEHLAELYSDMTSLQVSKSMTSPILDHFGGPEEYSLITTSIVSAVRNAKNDGLIRLPENEVTGENLDQLFMKDRELEKKFAENYLVPEMRKVFNTALKQAKDVLKEEGSP